MKDGVTEPPAAVPAAAPRQESIPGQAAPAAAGPPTGRIFLVFLLWNALWWGAVGAFAAPFLPGGWLAVLALAAAGLAPLLVLRRVLAGTLYPGAAVRLFVLRPFWYIQLGLPLVGLVTLLGALVGLPFGAGHTGGQVAFVGAASVYALLLVAGYVGSRRLVVRHLEAVFEHLPEGLEGLRIAQVSDLHVGPHTPRRHLSRIRAAVEGAAPDLIAITGDQVDDHDQDVAPFTRAFGSLRAPLGVYAIAGNHDVYA
ncbi:MAG TPA: metallophosphoesterase, partial [Candidatus Thermoplasmatota archaeon]|nr:metallophosphoesterase [Candidatus Thermoplasmatota archaeon]